MSNDIEKIFNLLKENLSNSCAKYSNFRVSAALESNSGELYFGVNVESSSYGLTICAEQTALVKGLSYGERKFKAIFILAETNNYIRPCGACRQLLFDYCEEIDVYMFSIDGSYQKMGIKELLPFQFNL
jgi:cytidine deaminase